MLLLHFVLKVANLIHLVTNQAYEKLNLVVCCTYEEYISMKNLGFNVFGKESAQCYKNICHPELNHLKINQQQSAGIWLFEHFGSMFKVDPALKLPVNHQFVHKPQPRLSKPVQRKWYARHFCWMNSTIATFWIVKIGNTQRMYT